MKNLVLIGFMGCGKSTLGKKAARAMDRRLVDMDTYIEKKAGMPITQIFEEQGEAAFRAMELETAKELGTAADLVISTGGGVVKNPQLMETLKQNGVVIYLRATPEQIYRNTKNDTKRPLLQGGDRMEKIVTLLNERKALYEAWADGTVDVGGPLKETAERIIRAWEEKA